jgi:hypothetical protein
LVTAVAATIEVNQGFLDLLGESWSVIEAWGKFLWNLLMSAIQHYPTPTVIVIGVVVLFLLIRMRRKKSA